MGIRIIISGKEQFTLTSYTITKFNKRKDAMDEINEYLSGSILGIELWGKMDIYNDSEEIAEIKKLSEWSKQSTHEEDVYRKIYVERFDANDDVYDFFSINQAFVVEYKESYHEKKGYGEFYIFIRELDHTEDKIKK